MKNSKSKKEILIVDGITMGVAGFAIQAIFPPFWPIVVGLKLGCVASIGFVAITHCKYDKVFRNCNLFIDQSLPILKYKTVGEYSTIYHFTIPAGLCLQDFLDNEEAIQNYVGKEIRLDYSFKELILEEFHDKMKSKYDYEPIKIKGNVPIIVGYDRKGELKSCDLSNGEPHMLIAGQTGGGKSTALRCILANLILKSNAKLHLVDLKNGVELRIFANSKSVLTFSRNMSQARCVLKQIDQEVDARYDMFYKENVKDIEEYNKNHKNNKLDYQVLVCDEFADFQSEKDLQSILDNLGRKARACGIHMILSTQRPDMKVLNGSIKSNVPVILGLKATNVTNSRIIIDEGGLEKLRGNGHGIFRANGSVSEVQVPFISTSQTVELVKSTYINKSYLEKENTDISLVEVETL